VLGVTAWSEGIKDALRRAYHAIGRIQFDGMQFRRDIGYREVLRAGAVREASEREA
jgi:phosphoribosylamine--glycine ligase